MKLLIITNYFPPEIGAASHLFFELAESLADRGVEVTVLTGFPRYNLKRRPKEYRGKLFMTESMGTPSVAKFDVVRVGFTAVPFSRVIPVLRGIDQFWTAVIFFCRALFLPRHDLVFFYSPPLTLGLTARWLEILKRMPFAVNVQDLFPQNAIDLGLLKSRVLIRMFERMERFVYRTASLITVHSGTNKKFVQQLIASSKQRERVHTVSNWVDTEHIRPGSKVNDFSTKYSLPQDKFIVSFAGVLGYSQGTPLIIEAAEQLQKEAIYFVIVGDGPDRAKLERASKHLDNVQIIDMQPRNVYPDILAASDACLVTLKANVKTPVVPSKILSIMAAGRPVVASMPLTGDAPKLIKQAKAGVVLKPERADLLAQALLSLSKQKEHTKKYGANGRSYAQTHLSRDAIIHEYKTLFENLLQ